MKSIKGTMTEQNLLKAFAGESQARNRYTFFASVAKKEGYEQIAGVFMETAEQEKEHAKRFFKYLEGGPLTITASYPAGIIGTTTENLLAAAEGEHEEWDVLYAEFGDVAEKEGFPEIANTFRQIAKVEAEHEKRYLKLLSRITDGILLEAVGKTGGMYKVRLSKNRTAYIPEDCVEQAPEGMLPHQSLVEAWSVRGNDKGDVVTISLSERLPFATFQMTDPSRICVDIFGAVANTSWITQIPDTWNVISHVDYEQIEEDIFRVILTLRNDQHWGHSVSYNGTSMVIRVKKQPELTLRGMHIALDAGHGGESRGAVGTTGCNEKDINLAIVKELKSALESRGAKITLTRDGDYDVSMNDRLLLLRKADPDLLISIHCNAGGSPFTGKGTSTYYRHIGFRPLSTAILSRVLTLGVNNFGNIGSFNFALSSPTEYPNVLVETLFMSSPEDEARLMDPEFRTDLVKQIVKGLEDFLRETKKNSK